MIAALPDFPTLAESIVYQLSGLLVVFLALGAIWLVLEISGAVFRRSATTRAATSAAEEPVTEATPAVPAPVIAPEISPLTCALITATVHAASKGRMRILSVAPEPEVLHAIIAAAVHCAFEGRARVVSVQPLHSDPSWAREGRRDIFSSHRIR